MRFRSLAPAGGWSAEFQNQWALDYFITQQDLVKGGPYADQIASTRKPAPGDLLHRLRHRPDHAGNGGSPVDRSRQLPAAKPMVGLAREQGFELDAGGDRSARFRLGHG